MLAWLAIITALFIVAWTGLGLWPRYILGSDVQNIRSAKERAARSASYNGLEDFDDADVHSLSACLLLVISAMRISFRSNRLSLAVLTLILGGITMIAGGTSHWTDSAVLLGPSHL